MIEANNPEINVDDLMKKVKAEAQKQQLGTEVSPNQLINHQSTTADSIFVSRIDALLQNAKVGFREISEIPGKFNRFPFDKSPQKQLIKIFLKVYNFLFKKQRAVNQNFIDAFELLKSALVSIESTNKIIETRSQIVEHRNQNLVTEVKALQTEVAHYKQLLSNLSKNTNNSDIQSQAIDQELEHLQDAFYVAFEDKFRGNSEEIKKRLEVYLPILKKANLSTSESILDLGCGRGEWLQLLQDNGYKATGIDCNRVMVAECQTQNLDVHEADAIAHLQSLPSESLAGVTGFHIIEHLPFPQLLQLFAETIRVLKPSGIAIFETPNPQNVMVGSKSFYFDPTHRNPLPNELTQFLLERTGFEPVEILPLNPGDSNAKIPGDQAITQRFNELFYGFQDYAVIGYKITQDASSHKNIEEEIS